MSRRLQSLQSSAFEQADLFGDEDQGVQEALAPGVFESFTEALSSALCERRDLTITFLSNIFTMRSIGNKLHGDLAELAITEFIKEFVAGYDARHVGKELFRSKEGEEDVTVVCKTTDMAFPLSIKAYGDGPLQLSTDKRFEMFPFLEKLGTRIECPEAIETIWASSGFAAEGKANVVSLIYDEKQRLANVMTFNQAAARQAARIVVLESEGSGRKHPVYRFYDSVGCYIFEVRYGGATANALQRGMWTNTKTASRFFSSLSGGWIPYRDQPAAIDVLKSIFLSGPEAQKVAASMLNWRELPAAA